MALHRDIYWVGRQWAVTGYGLQACDQKQKSAFDIEAGKLWEAGALENVRAQKWLNAEDFDKGLELARQRYQTPSRNGVELPRQERTKVEERPKVNILPAVSSQPTAPLAPRPKLEARKPETPKPQAPKPEISKPETSKPETSKPETSKPEVPGTQKLVPIELKQRIADIKGSVLAKRDAVEPSNPATPKFHASFSGSAKFVKPWHLRQKR